MTDIRSAAEVKNILGESPIWCAAEARLYWVDVRAPAVFRLDPESGKIDRWKMPELVGSLAVCHQGTLLLALQRRLSLFDQVSGTFNDLFRLPESQPGQRFNDGKCDPAGRFVAGTLLDQSEVSDGVVQGEMPDQPEGVLYQFDADGEYRTLFGGITIPNSLAWSPDGHRMYFADTAQDKIYAYLYDMDSGVIGPRKIFADTTDLPGQPDGSTVDSDGYLWNAAYRGGCIIRYAPDGSVDRVIELPVFQPTCCAFGGKDLATLYVTSATQRLHEADLAHRPMSGHVLALDVGVSGLPEPVFGGPQLNSTNPRKYGL